MASTSEVALWDETDGWIGTVQVSTNTSSGVVVVREVVSAESESGRLVLTSREAHLLSQYLADAADELSRTTD